jgi:DNA-binding response OmpR family regulator
MSAMAHPTKMRKRCILLAEDQPEIRQLLTETLRKDGFEVLAAADGEAALKRARNYKGIIDLLITDVEMPRIDGFDLQERLLDVRPGVKLLVISGALGSNIKGTDFPLLRKPFLPTALIAKVNEILGYKSAGPETDSDIDT